MDKSDDTLFGIFVETHVSADALLVRTLVLSFMSYIIAVMGSYVSRYLNNGYENSLRT